MASARIADQLGIALTRLTNLLREAVLPPGMNSAQARTLLALHDAGPQRVTSSGFWPSLLESCFSCKTRVCSRAPR